MQTFVEGSAAGKRLKNTALSSSTKRGGLRDSDFLAFVLHPVAQDLL